MTDQQEIYTAIFKRFCGTTSSMSVPYKLDDYYWATNGHMLIGLPCSVIDLDFIDGEPEKKPRCKAVIPQDRMEPIVLPVDRSIEKLVSRPTSKVVECELCGGTGELECNLGHDHDCENCDGTGETKEYLDIKLHGRIFLAEYLYDIFISAKSIGCKEVRLTYYAGERKAHLFEFGEMVAILMPKAPNEDIAHLNSELPELI